MNVVRSHAVLQAAESLVVEMRDKLRKRAQTHFVKPVDRLPNLFFPGYRLWRLLLPLRWLRISRRELVDQVFDISRFCVVNSRLTSLRPLRLPDCSKRPLHRCHQNA